jgi:hypothetical protein
MAEKARARRTAVAWPMPWLAPVTMATDFGIQLSFSACCWSEE